jgi:DNA processing protein
MKAALPVLPLNSVMEDTPSPVDDQERLCFLALSLVEFLTPWEKHRLLGMLGGAVPLFHLPLAEISHLLGRRMITRAWHPEDLLGSADDLRCRLTADGTASIFYGDSQYPPLLRETRDPPLVLFLRGSLPGSDESLAGIVGTRFPTGAGRQAAFRLGRGLGAGGVWVVSGLARGIDREAHEGCEQAGGRSVAVLGNGIDLVYPSSSRAAAMALLRRGGGILSEYPPGVPPLRWHFPARNRIISGLSRGVVIVEAPERSGALFTAEFALDQNRDLWVHESGLQGSTGAGTRRLAEEGAPVIRGAGEILRSWGMESVTEEEEISGARTPRAGET